MSDADLAAIVLTAKLAALTTLLLLLLCTPLAWWLARSRARWIGVVHAIVALPLVLPPTVIGFYLLVALGPQVPGHVPAQVREGLGQGARGVDQGDARRH